MYFDELQNRTLISVAGEDAEHFLENLITCNVTELETDQARLGALLTPQGKILYDFFLMRSDAGYLVDIHESLAAEFAKRLMFYRLRAKVAIDQLQQQPVIVLWDNANPANLPGYRDSRHPNLGCRVYDGKTNAGKRGDYNEHRLKLGIPEGGCDFEYGDAYPHETLMDQFGGVDFKKGCYVGQEVVSRMQHRGSARKRIVRITAGSKLPQTGTPILADGKPAGTLGTAIENYGLALLRLDRVVKAETLTADEMVIRAELQDWVNFSWPEAD